MSLFGDNAEGPELLRWWPVMPAFLVDTSRVNLQDFLHSFARPGTIIRVEEMDGPPIVPFMAEPPKWYPIEDEL